MKKINLLMFMSVLALMVFTSCERVAPNYVGVLMENYGKAGKSDFTLQKGRVSTWQWGTELFQVPLYEQRADFGDRVLHLKSADNTDFSSRPSYLYKVIESRSVDVVFNNKQLGSGKDFMKALEDNILEAKIYDIMKEESRKYSTEFLMATTTLKDSSTTSGTLIFENAVAELIKREFESRGFELMTFSCPLEFTDKVKAKIDNRNEVNTNISVIDQQIVEQRKKLELREIESRTDLLPLILAKQNGVLNEYMQTQFYDAWKITKQPIYGMSPTMIKSLP